MNVVFVCTGNTCRSPMAAAYLNSKKINGLTATSRGLAADGSPACDNAIAVLKEFGLDISSHISKQLTREDIISADKIICLSDSHLSFLKNAGVDSEKLLLLGGSVADPFGGDKEIYRLCRDKIFGALDSMVEKGVFDGLKVSKASEKDIPVIAEIEKECFSEPWSQEGIKESFENGTLLFIAEKNGEEAGYIGINSVLDEGYITNIAVFPKYRNAGVGTALLRKIFEFAGEKKLAFVSLEVRVSNSKAISLYEKNGFKTEGRRKDFYRNPKEDALIMTKRF